MNQQDRRQQTTSSSSGGVPVQRAAGKRSRSDGLTAAVMAEVEEMSDVPVGALQLSAASPPAAPSSGSAAYDDPFGLHLDGSAAHATAERGVSGSGGRLPHLDTIQASFGRHDISGVAAHTGGAAAQATDALGAQAYATGNKIAFGSTPSLHTAAHEAAHVVQQRQGVSLKGGVGESGDPYEQHADRVADAVVAGRSAESLLDHGPGGGSTTAAIQKEDKPGAAPAVAPAAAPADGAAAAPAVPPPDTEGDKLRKAVLAAAEKRLKDHTTIVSQAKIDDVRTGMVNFKIGTVLGVPISLKLPLGTPMKNFTTCIEFAGQTFGDGTKAVGQGTKDQANLAKLLPQFLMMMNKEIELHNSLEAFQKSIHIYDKPIADTEKRQADMKKEIKDLKGKQNSGDKQADTQTNTLLKTKETALKQIDDSMAKIEKGKKGIQDKIDKLQKELTAIDAKDDAWIKPQPGMKNGRPKPGEYILSGAAEAQSYGVKTDTKVTLAKGSFKHIAVFKSKVAIDPPMVKPPAKKGQPAGPAQPRPGKWEEWTTIDGGNIEAKESKIIICLDDLHIFHVKPEGSWAVAASQLLGWIDMNTLVSDGRKAGGAAPAPGAAPAAPGAAPAAPAPKPPAAAP